MAQQFTSNCLPGRHEVDAVVVENGTTTCQLCTKCGGKIENSRLTLSFRQPNEVSLCYGCERTEEHGYSHRAHAFHFLSLVKFMETTWTCNGCNRPSTTINDTACYVCSICNFYLCQSCFEPKKCFLHEHVLEKTDVRIVYSGGSWKCDCCGGNNGFGQFLPWHCGTCKFDLCEKCCEPQSSTLHLHKLYRADARLVYQRFSGAGWRCDCCGSLFRPYTDNNAFSYHCNICEFDLCENCMKITNSKVARPASQCWNRGAMRTTESGYPVASPEDELSTIDSSAPTPDSGLCIICLSKPKDATIVHGETGHVCCCFDCAKKLECRRDRCPICRQPIQMVIQQFLA